VTPENVECRTCHGKPWFKKVWWDYHHPDRLITLPDAQFDVVPSRCPDCTPENVECPDCDTCGGSGYPNNELPICSDCDGTGRRTPENVDTP